MLMALAAVCLLLVAQSTDSRAPAGLLLALPLLPVQVLAGLIPALHYARKENLVGSARRWLLWPAVAGSVLFVACILVDLLFFRGGC
ncbi:MAG: hypothetical protein IT456_04820 [Planctomycetes bacterium]|nr:hypothetical protein [Planctomycetota bacterium]